MSWNETWKRSYWPRDYRKRHRAKVATGGMSRKSRRARRKSWAMYKAARRAQTKALIAELSKDGGAGFKAIREAMAWKRPEFVGGIFPKEDPAE